ncbi:2,3-bisphosphoglycerate-independent phosphoglycerate mutase, partial [Clarias magur]
TAYCEDKKEGNHCLYIQIPLKEALGNITVLNRLISPQSSGSVTAPGHMTWKRKARSHFGSLS